MFNFINVLKDPNSWAESGKHKLSDEPNYKHHKRCVKPVLVGRFQSFVWAILFFIAVIPAYIHDFTDYGISTIFVWRMFFGASGFFITFNILVFVFIKIATKKSVSELDDSYYSQRIKSDKIERKHMKKLQGMSFSLRDSYLRYAVPEYDEIRGHMVLVGRKIGDEIFNVEIAIESVSGGSYLDQKVWSLEELCKNSEGGIFTISKCVRQKNKAKQRNRPTEFTGDVPTDVSRTSNI